MADKEYIEREAATCKKCFHYDVCSIWSTTDLEKDEAYKYCYGNFIPAADVQEVRRGVCEKHPFNESIYYCSVCGEQIEDGSNDPNKPTVHFPYCHCGAKMG